MKNSSFKRITLMFGIVFAVGLFLMAATGAIATPQFSKSSPAETPEVLADAPVTSHRLIVELESPALATSSAASRAFTNGQLDVNSAAAQAHINRLQQEQTQFIKTMQASLPSVSVATFKNELGQSVNATYQVLFNGVAVDAGQSINPNITRDALLQMANVKAVYFDYAYQPDTYASLELINAPAAWDSAAIGGKANAGKGVLFASVDGGLHHDSPMFSGDGWEYPTGWPAGGKGDSQNNNGKIVASRVYFRDWDPPTVGDENSWPGENGTSHGVHTGSTAVGNEVQNEFLGSGITDTLSGVAPAAWAMSYRVFYPSNGPQSGSAFSVELMAAIEDAVADGAHVINNSWGGGPGSFGGEFDALDKALVNAVNSGVFVSMSAGNAGPGLGTGDHPSDAYINVAASTTSGTYASGQFNIIAPDIMTGSVKGASYASASFGPSLDIGKLFTYTFATAAALEPSNFEGCNPFTVDFTGKAAVISRGACEFGVKVYNAQQAGADFVVVYNHAAGGDGLINMGPGVMGGMVNIPSIFIGKTNGDSVVAWYATHGAASALSVDTRAFQAGNTPDQIAGFSSRGPSAGQALKPDIAAPGVNIMAQGYGNATGEARHTGFGQVSGTSMAAPHVAGAAVLLRQMYPTWGMAEIKAALMGSAKYMDIYNGDGSPAQPLDMGAGRLDFTQIVSPGIGVILNPPSLSYGYVPTGTTKSIEVKVTSVSSSTETYALSTLYTGDSFTATTSLPGFTVSPMTLTLAAGESAMVTVEFDSAMGQGEGDNQGYLILDGATYDSHAAMWARVIPQAQADVLLLDADLSPVHTNYVSYYTDALDELGLTYDTINTIGNAGLPSTIPSAAEMAGYKAVVIFTGDHFQPDGTFLVSTALTQLDMDRLTEYANAGGILISMGQDLSGVTGSDETDGGNFFYSTVLGADWLKDSISGGSALPNLPVNTAPDAPSVLDGKWVDLSTGQQSIVFTSTMSNTASGSVGYNMATNQLTFDLSVNAYTSTMPVTVTAAHIHTGTVGMNGGVAVNLNVTTTVITDSAVIASGTVTLTAAQETTMLANGYYINIHTTAFPGGEMRGQLPAVNGDGAGNQMFVDEIRIPLGTVLDGGVGFVPLMTYPSPNNTEDGIVAMMHRDQPSLERPGTSSNVRSIYTTFGLEGVNDGTATDRADLLGLFMDMLMDEPVATVMSDSNTYTSTAQAIPFSAGLTSNVTGTVGSTYRWDFGDGTAIVDSGTLGNVTHQYAEDACGAFVVRVEVTDNMGNVSIGSDTFNICQGKVLSNSIYLPLIMNGEAAETTEGN